MPATPQAHAKAAGASRKKVADGLDSGECLMYVDAPAKAWENENGRAMLTLTQTKPMTPNEALEVAEKLRLIALIARGLERA